MAYDSLNPSKALIWRILHRDNLDWVLSNGLHCGNSTSKSPTWVNIGSADLISKRATHPVPITPGGVLNDYVPFYFTPFSVMMMNIRSGRGVQRRSNDEIVILVASLHNIAKAGLPYVFTDSHAYYRWSNYYTDVSYLSKIDWEILQNRDFRRDPEDPAKFERYQAEALIHKHLPISAIEGIVCYTEAQESIIKMKVQANGLTIPVFSRTNWYF